MAASPPVPYPPDPDKLRRLGLALAITTVVIALIATQWPFEYRLTRYALHRHWARIDWSWFPRDWDGNIRIDRDFAVNLLMLIPLGVGYGLWRRGPIVRVAAEALVLGILTSTVLELAQLATRQRYTSPADVWRNAVSSLLGCLLARARFGKAMPPG